MSLLEVTDLKVSFHTSDGIVQAVRGISFAIDSGRTLGIVGESGSGKSVSTQTLMGLNAGARVSGTALFEGQDLLTMSPEQLRRIRGAQIGMIFQDPLSSLHPYYTVGWQIVEMIQAHRDTSRAAAQRRAAELLSLVGIPHASQRINDYPHQFSGGMRQRVMIAMAMALDPALLVADEPTTALDVTVQAQILDLMRDLKRRVGAAIVLITHDLGVVAEVAEHVVVMYAGRKVEEAPVRVLFGRPRHPYTKGLLGAVPKIGSSLSEDESRLAEIPGLVPALKQRIEGCVFASRCAEATAVCRSVAPALEAKATAHWVACHYAEREAVPA